MEKTLLDKVLKDKALMWKMEVFMIRDIADPLLMSKNQESDPTCSSDLAKKRSESKPLTADTRLYKYTSGGLQSRFTSLVSIVNFMKRRYLDGETHPLSIDDILDKTNLLNVGMDGRQWLIDEALPNSSRIREIDGKYLYKPPLPVHDRKTLLEHLHRHKGFGGILLDYIQDSVPDCKKVMKQLDKDIIHITRPSDKKKIVFYKDKRMKIHVDEKFQCFWRSTSVDGLSDNNIEEYLRKQGINHMQEVKAKTRKGKKKIQ